MTIGSNTFFPKQTSINFVVKNISAEKKTISLFNCPIGWNQSRDLLAIPEVSEADIKESLIKGDLAVKIRSKDITITSSSIDLIQFDAEQKNFLIDAGVTNGVTAAVSKIVWDESDHLGDAKTWDDVMEYIKNSNAPIEILISSDKTIPAGTYDLKRSILSSLKVGGPEAIYVTLEDGAVLHDAGGFGGAFTLKGNSTSGPCFTFSPTQASLPPLLYISGNVFLTNHGTVPMIEVEDNGYFVLVNSEAGSYGTAGSASFINLGSAATLIMAIEHIIVLTNNFVTGASDSTLIIENFGYLPSPMPSIPGFLGFLGNSPFSYVGGSGPTSLRPQALIYPMFAGTTYFDLDLSPPRPIWWSGTQWVDSIGTPV